MSQFSMEELVGREFGRLTVIAITHTRDESFVLIPLCKCTCGSLVMIKAAGLFSGSTRSCGCETTVQVQEIAAADSAEDHGYDGDDGGGGRKSGGDLLDWLPGFDDMPDLPGDEWKNN